MMRKMLWAAPAVLLSGCITIGAKPPPTLLTLTASADVPVGRNQHAAVAAATTRTTLAVGDQPVATLTNGPLGGDASITVAAPTATQEVAGLRVPVRQGPTAIAYVKGAQWVEPPARLFARLLSDTITARTGRVVLSSAQSFQTGSAQLTGDMRSFGIDEGGRQAVVVFDASLLRVTGGGIDKQRFEARVPVASIDAEGVGPALNSAANQVAAKVADWVGR